MLIKTLQEHWNRPFESESPSSELVVVFTRGWYKPL